VVGGAIQERGKKAATHHRSCGEEKEWRSGVVVRRKSAGVELWIGGRVEERRERRKMGS
jgi:hypothetical protein